MKTDKEYPATHSMSTAWYMVDEDGNVGIMDFNENGPVPRLADPQICIEDLVYGYEADYKNKIFWPIALTDDQIDDIMEKPHSPEDEDDWGFNTIIQIDIKKEDDFLKLAEDKNFEIEFCISKRRGLYSIDAFECTKNNGKPKVHSVLKRMIDNKIIINIYKKKDFDLDDDWNNGVIIHTKKFTSAPFFIFHQPYWAEALPKCMNVPKNPVKINQLSPDLQRTALKVPVKFSENGSFQIAEWYPSYASENTKIVEGCEYSLLPLSDGTNAYINTKIIKEQCFINYCSQRAIYDCDDCTRHCYSSQIHYYTNEPTVLFIKNVLDKHIYPMSFTDKIARYGIWVPIMPRIPIKIPIGPHVLSNSKYEGYVSESDIKKHINRDILKDLFQKNYKWLEDVVKRFNPYVIILDNKEKNILKSVFQIEKNQIIIGGQAFPLFMMSKLEENRAEIERLAQQPYRGKVIPYIISVKEMKQLKKAGKCCECES
jgi:hypothetical protein